MTLLKTHTRQLGFGAAALVVGALLFASGIFVARATENDDAAPPARDDGDSVSSPSLVRQEGASGSNPAPAADIDKGGAGAAGSLMPYWGCSTPIEAALQGTSFDPARLGFSAALPGSGFQFEGASLRAETGCKGAEDEGQVRVVLDTRWRHAETGIEVTVSQAQSPDAIAPVVDMGGARFSRDGYSFWLNVVNMGIMPVDVETPRGGVAIATSPGMPGYDPRTAAVLDAALKQLDAPESQCFYRQRLGTWEDLATLGIGDPRSAVPSGLNLADFSFFRMDPPSQGCNVPELEYESTVSINANWYGEGKGGYLNIGVNEFAKGPSVGAGSAGQGHFAWNNGKYQFYVSGQDASGPMADETLQAIARLLDPGFDNRCTMASEFVKFEDLAGLGLREPAIPEGFKLQDSSFTRLTAHGDCSQVEGAAGGFRAEWHFWGGTPAEGAIGLVVTRGVRNDSGFPANSVFPYGMTWTNGELTYFIYEKGDFADDVLVAVAKSVDPAFDLSRLSRVDTPSGPDVAGGADPVARTAPADKPLR